MTSKASLSHLAELNVSTLSGSATTNGTDRSTRWKAVTFLSWVEVLLWSFTEGRMHEQPRSYWGRGDSPDRAAGSSIGFLVLVLGLCAAVPQAGQQQPPQKQQEPPVVSRTVFRAGVEYVPLDVIVTDDHGHVVTDLTADDFAITESGRKQTIRNFEHVVIPQVRRAVDLHATPAPPPDVATNVAPGPSSRAFVFVIDDGTIKPEAIVPLKRAMTEFLQTLSPVDRVAIVFVRRSDFAVDFTSDIGRLVRGVGNIDKMVGSGGADARAARLVLLNVVTALAAAPETRRTLVFLSGGNPIAPKQPGLDVVPGPSRAFTFPGLQDLFDRARNADVSIYTVDPSGMLTLDTGITSGGPPSRRLNSETQDFMRTLPYNTGGLALVNINDMPAAADAVVQDNSDYYVLGYSPTPFVADRKFHDVEVTVTTRSGLHVRGRKGYLAETPVTAASPAAGVTAALGDAQPRSDLGLRVFLAPVWPKANGATAVLTIDVDYPAADVPVRPDDDLDAAFLALDPDGQVMKSQPQTFHVALSTARRGAVTVSLDDVLDLPRGKWTLRVGVASRLLGTLGTVHFPVDVPSFGGKTLETSPLVLGLSETTTLVGRPESIAALVPLQPTTARTFAAGTRLRLFARAFSPKPSDVKVDLRLTQNAKVVRTLQVRIAPAPGTSKAMDCEAAFALTDLPAGAYIVELTAHAAGRQARPEAIAINVK
jgi:VWFA-related protein